MARLNKSGLGIALGLTLLGAAPKMCEPTYANPASSYIILEKIGAFTNSYQPTEQDRQQSVLALRVLGITFLSGMALAGATYGLLKLVNRN